MIDNSINNDPSVIEAVLHSDLNNEQRRAAMIKDGPVIVIAGAGTGKTKTLIHRMATLLMSGIAPTNIMAVTFTNKAAGELKERLFAMVGEKAEHVAAGTFHSIVFREILKKYPEAYYLASIGINMWQTSILDEVDSKKILKEAFAELDEHYHTELEDNDQGLPDLVAKISLERAQGRDVKDLMTGIGSKNKKGSFFDHIVAELWQKYNEKCRQVSGIDFDDILLVADKMLSAEPDIAKELSQQFKYVMLDEYQDTNRVQMNIMDSIVKHHRNILVVGDEKQSIYGFRGSDIGIILSFKQRYPDAVQINLNKNYRSCQQVIGYANVCAKKMEQKLSDGQLVAMSSDKSSTPSIVGFKNDKEEAALLAAALQRDIRSGVPGGEIAVLYRKKAAKKEIESALIEREVPYLVVGDTSFYQRAEVKDAVALLRFLFQSWDSMAGLRILDVMPVSVSSKAAKTAMKKDSVSVMQFLKMQAQKTTKIKRKDGEGFEPTVAAKKIGPFVEMAEELRKVAKTHPSTRLLVDCVSDIWDIYLRPTLERKASREVSNGSDNTAEDRVDNVKHVISRFESRLESGMTVEEAIEDLTLMIEAKPDLGDNNDQKVHLMTIHASKGLEFENVYLVSMDYLSCPGERAENNLEAIEEERRTVYVGMTRAKKKLAISYAQAKMEHGIVVQTEPSPFVEEIQSSLGIRPFIYEASQKARARYNL